MTLICGVSIDVDLQCEECGHEWQETFYEEHIQNAIDLAENDPCPRCDEGAK